MSNDIHFSTRTTRNVRWAAALAVFAWVVWVVTGAVFVTSAGHQSLEGARVVSVETVTAGQLPAAGASRGPGSPLRNPELRTGAWEIGIDTGDGVTLYVNGAGPLPYDVRPGDSVPGDVTPQDLSGVRLLPAGK